MDLSTNYELIDVSDDGEVITISHWENNIPYGTRATYGGVGAVMDLWTARLDYSMKYLIPYSPTGYQKDITFNYNGYLTTQTTQTATQTIDSTLADVKKYLTPGRIIAAVVIAFLISVLKK